LDGLISDTLCHGIRSIAAEQLPHGEIPNYRRLPNGSWEYCFSPLVSAYTYTALSCFDPSSSWFDLQALESSGATSMQTLGRMAMEIRRGIHRFLCWQQSVDATWQFFGQGSGLPADLDTTCCGSAIFLDRRQIEQFGGFRRTWSAISRFPLYGGIFDTPDSRGPEFDGALELRRIANANLLRCLSLAGVEHEELASALLQDFAGDESTGSSRIALLYVLGRAYRQGQVAMLAEISTRSTDEIKKMRSEKGDFGGPLSTAMALSAFVDFGATGDTQPLDLGLLAANIMAPHRARLEVFCDERCGSAALTTAISMQALSCAGALAIGGNSGS